MTTIQTGLAMLDSVKAAQKAFTNYLAVIAICANYNRDGQSVNDTLSQLRTITNDGIREVANEVAHSFQSQVDEGLSERTRLLLAGLGQLQQCWRNFNSEELEREIRDNLLTFQRDGLEIQYLHEINAVQTVIKSDLAQNDSFLRDIEDWGNEHDGEIWIFCEIGRNTRQRLIQVAESIARFVGRSMYKGQFIEPESTTTDQEPQPAVPGKKLTWQGDKKVLINAFRKLKTSYNKNGQYLIKESSEDIAVFLIQHINGFENNQISTLSKQLSRELDDPKGNFVPLELD